MRRSPAYLRWVLVGTMALLIFTELFLLSSDSYLDVAITAAILIIGSTALLAERRS